MVGPFELKLQYSGEVVSLAWTVSKGAQGHQNVNCVSEVKLQKANKSDDSVEIVEDDFEAMTKVVEKVEQCFRRGYEVCARNKVKFYTELVKTKNNIKFQVDMRKKMKTLPKKPKAAVS